MTCKYIVQGIVQGVGFRYFVAQTAGAFDISGSVRNLPDGSVEIIVNGTEESIQAFREQIGIGPRHARVDRIVVEQMQDQVLRGFRVLGREDQSFMK